MKDKDTKIKPRVKYQRHSCHASRKYTPRKWWIRSCFGKGGGYRYEKMVQNQLRKQQNSVRCDSATSHWFPRLESHVFVLERDDGRANHRGLNPNNGWHTLSWSNSLLLRSRVDEILGQLLKAANPFTGPLPTPPLEVSAVSNVTASSVKGTTDVL